MKKIIVKVGLFGLAIFGYLPGYAEEDSQTTSSGEIERALDIPITRGISVRVRQQVDLHIPFEINSSSLKPEGRAQLEQLSDALRRGSLENYRFLIAGHTDASGAADYNRWLSRRRAESVKRFLVDGGIDPDRLDVTGNGEDDLLLPDDPMHGDNRRVEITNLGEIL